MNFKNRFAATVLLSLGLASGLAVAETAKPVKVALVQTQQTDDARPLAVMLDQPTGGAFVYVAEEGWKFSGRNVAAGNVDAPVPGAGQPVSLFVDGPTGFVFNYVVEKGWVFAGRVGDVQ